MLLQLLIVSNWKLAHAWCSGRRVNRSKDYFTRVTLRVSSVRHITRSVGTVHALLFKRSDCEAMF